MKMRFLAALVALFFASAASADVMVMKNGSRIIGTLVSAGEGTLKFDTPWGGTLEVKSENVLSIQTDTRNTVLMKDGEIFRDKQLVATERTLVMQRDEEPARRTEIRRFVLGSIWRYTRRHQNAWFAAVVCMVDPGNLEAKAICRNALASLSLKPLRAWGSPYGGQEHEPGLDAVLQGCDYNWVLPPHLRKPTSYWTWQKRPWDVGHQDHEGRLEEPGIDFLVPYWMGRANGFLP